MMENGTLRQVLDAMSAIFDSDCGVKSLNDAARLYASITGDHTYDDEFVVFDEDNEDEDD
jgi:hypothetical protein